MRPELWVTDNKTSNYDIPFKSCFKFFKVIVNIALLSLEFSVTTLGKIINMSFNLLQSWNDVLDSFLIYFGLFFVGSIDTVFIFLSTGYRAPD